MQFENNDNRGSNSSDMQHVSSAGEWFHHFFDWPVPSVPSGFGLEKPSQSDSLILPLLSDLQPLDPPPPLSDQPLTDQQLSDQLFTQRYGRLPNPGENLPLDGGNVWVPSITLK